MDNEAGKPAVVDPPGLDELFLDIKAALAERHQVTNDRLEPGEFTIKMWADHEAISYNTATCQIGYLLADGVLTRRRIKGGWAYRKVTNDQRPEASA